MRRINVIDLNGDVLDTFETLKDAAQFYGVKESTIIYRIKTQHIFNGEMVQYETVLPHDCLEAKRYKRNRYKKNENIRWCDVDKDNYKKVEYKIKMKHVCITPCPYSQSPKPMVGSARCEGCSRFKFRDSESKIVYCTGKV